MKTNIQHTKIELIQWLTTVEDQTIIQKIIALRESLSGDWWDTTPTPEKESILKGIDDAEKSNLKPHSEAKKIYEKWL